MNNSYKYNNIFYVILVTLLLLFGFVSDSYSQYNLLFNHLSVDDGLSENTIHTILQDKDGFMWFGTYLGLNKYDGYEFTVYSAEKSKPGALGSNNIIALYEDSYGAFWVGTEASGLYLFNREKEWFQLFEHENDNDLSLSNNKIRAIFEDSENNLWIGTAGGGLCLFNRADSTFKSFRNDTTKQTSIGSNYIGSIAEDSHGFLWLGSPTGELIKLNKANFTFTSYKLYKGESYYLSSLYGDILIDSDGDIWLSTANGMYIINPNTNTVKHLQKGNTKYNLNSNMAFSALEYTKNIFFIATGHGGLNIYNKATGEFKVHKHVKNDKTTISNNQLYTFYRSHSGNIWCGSYNGGLNILNDNLKFQQYKYILHDEDRMACCNSVLAVCEDLDGNIWVGYDGYGIDIFNSETISSKHITTKDKKTINSNIITSISRGKDGDIWIGHYLDGITHFDWQTKTYSHIIHQTDSLHESYLDNVYDILQVGEDELWIATVGSGLIIYNLNTKQYIVYNQDDGVNNSVYKILEDNLGNVWVGTSKGVSKINKYNKEVSVYLVADSLICKSNERSINDIFLDSKGELWLGTDNGLSLYQPKVDSFINYSEKDGLNGSSVKTILEDSLGNLWLSTNKGITKFNYKNSTFRNYDYLDGLQGRGFNRNSGLVSRDGKLYFGGPNGFNSFYPNKVKDNPNIPPIFITEFRIANKVVSQKTDSLIINTHINYIDEISLTYKQSDISFRFAALNYVNTSENKYKYILEGFDNTWVESGNKREASYTNLNPGTYTFKVVGSNNDGLWNYTGKSILINISPPFWKTNWFLALEILSLILIIIQIINLRNKKLRRDKRILTDKVESRTKELNEVNTLLEESKEEVLQQNEALVQHKENLESVVDARTRELIVAKERAEESDRLKSAFLANMSHEIRTPLNAIMGFSSLIGDSELSRSERERFASIIDSNSESLLLLIDDILDFSTIEANQLVLTKEAFYVNDFLHNLHTNYVLSNKKQEFRIILQNSVENKNLKINTDKQRLKQVLANLIQNALKFTNKGFIEIGLYIENSNLVFYVQDTGVGISESNIKNIFKRFRKIEESKHELFRGIGLGLSISKKLSEKLGGVLSVESKLGEGSIFKLSFSDIDIETKEDVIIQNKKKPIRDSWNSNNILIAEDETTNFLYLEKLLEKTNSNISWAKNGVEAVNIFKTNKIFDIVLMDIKMPKMDGFEALKLIREHKVSQIVIAQTAYARPKDEIKLENAGFDAYLSKPIKPDILYETLKKFI